MGKEIRRRGLMLVLSSPSGAGKTSISRLLLDGDPGLHLSVSVTTRPMRQGEVQGRDYEFVDAAAFARLRADGALLEHAEVFGHSYGTRRAPVMAALAAGRDVLFDIDWQGTQQLAECARSDLVSVFILPPSAEELHRRLRRRARDPEEIVAARMRKAPDEMSHWAEYDYILVNRRLEDSAARIAAILAAERLRRDRQVGLGDFVRVLSGGMGHPPCGEMR